LSYDNTVVSHSNKYFANVASHSTSFFFAEIKFKKAKASALIHLLRSGLKVRTQNLRKLMFVSIYIVSLITASFVGISFTTTAIEENGKITYSPLAEIVFLNNTPPAIDGDLESYVGEWENATIHHASFGPSGNRIDLTIRVQSNATHLFLGASYVSEIFIPINTTIPVGDSYNNQTHTWYSIVFDRNFDNRIGYSNETIDDAIVINYRKEDSQDAYFNGTTPDSLVLDVNMTGNENSISALTTELDDFNRYEVSFEVAKELDSKDTDGKDIALKEGETLRYLFIVYQNSTAAYKYTEITSEVTAWNTIHLETVHDYFSYEEDLSNLNILTYISDSSNTGEQELSIINTIMSSYDFNNSLKKESEGFSITYDRMKDMDVVILAGSHTDLTEDQIDDIRFFVASGGSLYVLGDTSDENSKLNDLLSNFGFQIYNETLYSENIGINSTIDFDTNDILNLPYLTQANILTNQTVSSIEYIQGSAIRFDYENETLGTLKFGEGYYQFQEGDLYASINKSGDFYIDQVIDGVFNSTEDISLNNSASIQAALELQRGGKLLAFASADIFNSSNILKADNKYLFLRQLSWLLNLQHQISYENFIIEDLTIIEGDNVSTSISVTGDEGNFIPDIQVWVVVQELKSDVNIEYLNNTGDNINFEGIIEPAESIKTQFIDVSIRIHKRGYGYNETFLVEVFMDTSIGTGINLNILALIIFVSSVGLAVIGALAIRRFKVVPEE